LRVEEKEDLPLIAEWSNSSEFVGEYEPLEQMSRAEIEKDYEKPKPEMKWFLIEKKDGGKVGFIGHYLIGGLWTIGYILVPNERNKGYATEAVKIMVDYLFLSKDIRRVQASINVKNIASQKVIEKNGFKKEGIVRQSYFARGEWRDMLLYSILREEWKTSKILTKTVPEK